MSKCKNCQCDCHCNSEMHLPKDAPVLQTSCVIELYDGADADGGEDLISELVVLLVVDVDSEPDW